MNRTQARIALVGALGTLLAVGLFGCAGSPSSPGTTTRVTSSLEMVSLPLATPTASSRTVQQAAQDDPTADPDDATPTPQPTPDYTTIRVWWPDEIYPADGSPAQPILTRQFDDFIQTYSNYDLQVRRKRANGLGGILPSLRTARPVAPGALPDLTLMRRADVVAAAAEGLIVPLDEWIPADLLEGLIPGVAETGQIDGVLYGVPYLLSLYHTAYRETAHPTPLLTFEDVLAQQPAYLFPGNVAGQGTAANWTVLLQYVAAGGRLVDDEGQPVLDQDPLLAVYSYYAAGVEQGIFGPDLLAYTQDDDYWDNFETGAASLIFVDTATYLRRRETVPNTLPALIPTLGGTPITATETWMWVLTTSDPDRQRQARAFLSWMMRVSQQSGFTEAYGLLPTAERALRLWDDQDYARFAEDLLAHVILVPDSQRSNSAAAALQAGFAAVLDGAPADAAADQALQLVAS